MTLPSRLRVGSTRWTLGTTREGPFRARLPRPFGSASSAALRFLVALLSDAGCAPHLFRPRCQGKCKCIPPSSRHHRCPRQETWGRLGRNRRPASPAACTATRAITRGRSETRYRTEAAPWSGTSVTLVIGGLDLGASLNAKRTSSSVAGRVSIGKRHGPCKKAGHLHSHG